MNTSTIEDGLKGEIEELRKKLEFYKTAYEAAKQGRLRAMKASKNMIERTPVTMQAKNMYFVLEAILRWFECDPYNNSVYLVKPGETGIDDDLEMARSIVETCKPYMRD